MDNLSELDDCINTLEQLQLTLDFETSTIKRNPKVSTSPLSPRFTKTLPILQNYTSSPLSQRCINMSPKSPRPANKPERFDAVPPRQTCTDQDFEFNDIPDLAQSSIVPKPAVQSEFEEEHQYPKSQIEMSDFQSVSVRHQKLMSNKSTDSDLFSVPEGDTTDFPPPPPPLTIDNDNYLNTYCQQTVNNNQRSKNKNSSPVPTNNTFYSTTPRKQSTNSLTLSQKPSVDPYSTLSSNIYNNTHSGSSSQSNISNFTDKEPKSVNSFPEIDKMTVKEDPSKQTVVRFFTTDKTTKAIVVTESMTVEDVIKILMEKHFWIPSLKSAVVEKVPSLKMERFFEEHEHLLNSINSWPSSCSNMIFFEPREDIYGLFENTKMYLGENYPLGSMNVDDIKNLFLTLSTEQHEYQDYLYIKRPGENSWKRKFCLLNHHGLFSIPKKRSKLSSPLTVMTFNERFYLYTSTGGWTKQWDAPTPFGFSFKPYCVVDPKSEEIIMFCAADEISMKKWCSNFRLCKYKNKILNNFQQMQNRSIYCSNLYSSNDHINRLYSLSPTTSKSTKYNFSARGSLPTSSLANLSSKSLSKKFKF